MILSELSRQSLTVADMADLAPLISTIKDRKLVCLGDASHGTHEFYDWRRRISLELIRNHGFRFVAFEGDWPDFEGVNDYLRGESKADAAVLLADQFRRWPSWMWANREMVQFAEELRQHNLSARGSARFHGLDLYSLHDSYKKVPVLLNRLDPALGQQAQTRFAGIEQSQELLRWVGRVPLPRGHRQRWTLFDARQNARVACNGRRFFEASGFADDRSWNIRDRHMLDTLVSLFEYYGAEARGIVWAHINHVGDLRSDSGAETLSLGGLAKQTFGEDAVALIPFVTHRGTVIASPRWAGPVQVLPVPPARSDSIEHLLHQVSEQKTSPSLLVMFDRDAREGPLAEPIAYRFVAVVYELEEERYRNYVRGSLPARFDAIFFVDQTRALEPLTVAGEVAA